MTSEFVTVVIPCYNQARFLREAIESVRRQTHVRHQVIVVDDGSTDDTATVAAQYAEVHLLRQANRGLAAARNSGLAAARGEYVVFLDADDRLLPDALEAGLQSLAAQPAAVFAYGHVKLIAGDGAPLPTPHQPDVNQDHYLELLRNNYIWTPGAVIYRRGAVAAAGGFDSRFNASADFALNVWLARRSPVRCTGRAALEYRLHDQNMTRNYALMLTDAVNARRAHRRDLPAEPRFHLAWRAGLAEVRRGYGEPLAAQARESFQAGQWARAADEWLTLLRRHPRAALKLCLPATVSARLRDRRLHGNRIQLREP